MSNGQPASRTFYIGTRGDVAPDQSIEDDMQGFEELLPIVVGIPVARDEDALIALMNGLGVPVTDHTRIFKITIEATEA